VHGLTAEAPIDFYAVLIVEADQKQWTIESNSTMRNTDRTEGKID
jgi:hypothetical protein